MSGMHPFILCFDNHKADGKVWCVKWKGAWRCAGMIQCFVPLSSVYKGPMARQPKAYLQGLATSVTRHPKSRIVIA